MKNRKTGKRLLAVTLAVLLLIELLPAGRGFGLRAMAAAEPEREAELLFDTDSEEEPFGGALRYEGTLAEIIADATEGEKLQAAYQSV